MRRVAVIGAGSSGLACVKACLDEGLEPVCFERGHDLGGVWNFQVSGASRSLGTLSGPPDFLSPLALTSCCSVVFRLQETSEPGRASIYRSLVSNTSKEMMCFSDFPMPAHFPNYLHNSQLLRYLHLFAERFRLFPHIRFQVRRRPRDPSERGVPMNADLCSRRRWCGSPRGRGSLAPDSGTW